MGNDIACKTVGISSICMKILTNGANTQGRKTCSRPEEKCSLWEPWKLRDTSSRVRMEFKRSLRAP